MISVSDKETYTGIVIDIYFRNEDYLVGRFKAGKESFTFTGNFYGIDKSDRLNITGGWVSHTKYGKQFNVTNWERPIPSNKEQVISFFASGLIKGVGKARAIDIADRLGDNAIEIIKRDGIQSLNGIKGIGKKTAERIVNSIKETFDIQEIMKALGKYGINTKICIKLFNEYGTETIDKVLSNPYLIMSVERISFVKMDSIAMQMGHSFSSNYRITACLIYTLNQLCNKYGHSFIEQDLLIQKALSTLNAATSIDGELITEYETEQVLYSLEEIKVMFEDTKVYPKNLFTYEHYIAQKLSILKGSRGGGALPKIEKHIKDYQKKNSIILAERQREAVYRLFDKNVLILTGKPGTGKTTTLKAMIDIYKQLFPKSIVRLSAPTGRASRKMYESTGYNAMTVHRLLGYKQGEIPEYNEDNKLEADLVVLDEWSMADLRLTYWLLSALKRGTKVIFIGDVDQLPSVSPGNVLNDFINAGLPTVRLNEIFRQAEESQIIRNAHRINDGKNLMIDRSKDDFYFIYKEISTELSRFIIKSALRFIELGYSLEDILILSPMKKGNAGTITLNEMLREAINPYSPLKNEIKIGNRFFREGDKIMQNINNADKNIFNGELGVIKSIELNVIDESGKRSDNIICEFDGQFVNYDREDLKEIELGYAITIHKSQGGEAPIVIMPITMEHKKMLARNLYYTGVTRAKEIVVLIGTDYAMDEAIRNDKIIHRNSLLDKRIKYAIENADRERLKNV